MQFKLLPLEVPSDDPFRFDGLERKKSVESVFSLISRLDGPFVLAIDSPWGTGKTTFVRMLKAFLELNGFSSLYFNAWGTDFATDPLIAFLGELDELMKGRNNKRQALERAKKIATVIAKRALPVAGKIATGGLLDLDDFTKEALGDLVSDTVTDAVDAYSAEKSLTEIFHNLLSESIEKFKADGNKPNLVVFVDEVDRCRPTFAIELLERIKHLFNVANILFLISIDKTQLGVSIKSVYGDGINADEYLRRFIDLEFTLPKANPKAFTKHLFARFGFEEFFAARPDNAFRYERDQLENSFNALSDLFDLSLRAREQCFTMLRVAMMTTPEDYFLYPVLLCTLIALKIAIPFAYRKYALESGSAADLLSFLRQYEGGSAFLESRIGITTEAYLVGARRNSYEQPREIENYKAILKDESRSKEEKERAAQIIRIVGDIDFDERIPSLAYITNKIELAAQFRTD